ncbi:MAG TPA: alpha/beta hydrolase [Caulobacteraceae bacterium]|jgi:acetyl esterase/lipase|nr:alpha/beta hydrolase [Caulobacteraceae bacterium]
MRRSNWLAIWLATLAMLAAAPAAGAPMALMNWPDLLGRPMPTVTQRIAYGPAPLQYGELWLPEGKGPFPVVLMVHGGCWRTSIANLTIMNYAAEDLRRRGIAVWNLEYRGVDRPGGGYPGTFQDVAAGADLLQTIGPAHNLKIGHVVAVGHSAGGHLAPWLAARARIPVSSPLHAAHPLPIAGVVSLGGLPDLEDVHAKGICDPVNVEKLVGFGAAGRDVWADTSPAALGAGPERQVFINGEEDGIAPPALDAAYVARMDARGARLRLIAVPDEGHVEEIAPGSAAWSHALEAIDDLLR